jgi:hypothetical protein
MSKISIVSSIGTIAVFFLTSSFALNIHPSSIILDLHVTGSIVNGEGEDLWAPVTLAEYKYEPTLDTWINANLFTVGGECNLTASFCFSRNSCAYHRQGQASLSVDGTRMILVGDRVSSTWPLTKKIEAIKLIAEVDPFGKSEIKEWNGCNTNNQNTVQPYPDSYACGKYVYRRPLGAVKLGRTNTSGYVLSCGTTYSGDQFNPNSGASLIYLQSNGTSINSSFILHNSIGSSAVNSGMTLTTAFSDLNISQLIVPVFNTDTGSDGPGALGAYLVGDYNTSVEDAMYPNAPFRYLPGTDTMVSVESNTVAVFVANSTSMYLCLNNPENQTPRRSGVVGLTRRGSTPDDFLWAVTSFFDLHDGDSLLESCGSLTGRLEASHLILYATSCVASSNCKASVWTLNTTDLSKKEIIKLSSNLFINSVILPPCDASQSGSFSCPRLVHGLWSIDTIIQPSSSPSPSVTPSSSPTSTQSLTSSVSFSSTCSVSTSPMVPLPSPSQSQRASERGGGGANLQAVSLDIGIVAGSVLGTFAICAGLLIAFKSSVQRLLAICMCCRRWRGGKNAVLRRAANERTANDYASQWGSKSTTTPIGLMPVIPSISGQAGNRPMAAPNASMNPLERQSQLAQARSYRAANAAVNKRQAIP